MKPVNFEGANKVLGAPSGANPVDYGKLPIHTDGVYCTSVWSLTDGELARLNETRGIIIRVRSGQTQHPLIVGVSDDLVVDDYVQPDPNEKEVDSSKHHSNLTPNGADNVVPIVPPNEIIIGESEKNS